MKNVSQTVAATLTANNTASCPSEESPIFQIGEDGWCIDTAGNASSVQHMPSPNYDARPLNSGIALLVIHNISLPPGQFGGPFIADLFCNRLDYDADPYFAHLRPLRVSAHFLIRRDGSVVQFVSTKNRAWHAGISSFDERQGCNDFSIGIELEGSDFKSFAASQYSALAALTDALVSCHDLVAVRGHSHIAPGRKTDPGPFFDWLQYQQGLAAHRPQPLAKPILRFPNED